MKLLKDIRRISFHRNKSTDSQLSMPSSGSPSLSNNSSADSSPPQSLLVLPESVQSNTSGSLSFAPIVDNFRQDQTVIYQVILLQGHVPAGPKPDGVLTIRDSKQRCPATTWPVSHSKFKALVYLHPGVNTVSLEYAASGSRSIYRSAYKLTYQPMSSVPPIKLVLLHAKDSQYASAENDEDSPVLALAKAKHRMAAYLWQCFMAENMNRLGHSRRTFQLETSWDESSLFAQDIRTSIARNQAPVHVIAMDKTVAELESMGRTDMIAYLETNLHARFKHFGKTQQYFSCLFLDTELDAAQALKGPSLAFGGKGPARGNLSFAVSGGQRLSCYPAAIDEVTSAFIETQSSHTSSEFSRSRLASLGLGEHLQRICHMLGLPKQTAGIMSDEFQGFGSAFSTSLASSVKEVALHPLDAIRLRYHPVLDAPWGPPPVNRVETGITFWRTSNTGMQISSRAGITAIEIFKANDSSDTCKFWMEFLSKRGPPRNKVDISFNDLHTATMTPAASRRTSIRRSQSQDRLRLNILTADGKEYPVADIETFAQAFRTTIPDMKSPVFTNMAVGTGTDGAVETSTLFASSSSRMLSMTVYHNPGSNISGIELGYETGTKYLLGSRAAESQKEWPLNVAGGETLMGMEVNISKTTKKLCGLRIYSNAARASPWFGAADDDVISYMLIPPETFQIIGMRGQVEADELQSLQFLIDR